MNNIQIQELPQSVRLAATILFQLRAEKVELMDLRGIKDAADFFLIATCESEAQMQAILNELTKEFKVQKINTLGVEYKSGVRWAVFDAGLDLMVHLFEETKREEVSFARLYSDAQAVELSEKDFEKEQSTGAVSDELI